jgi:Polyketide cyclase / dehydrase and lipid transport
VARYSFLTTWVLGAPAEIGRVFDALHDSVAYPTWWKGVQAVERLEEGDADGVGALDRYVWKSKLPYELEFQSRTVRVERPYLMEGEASGELEGTGRWRLWENPAGVCVTYEWNVGTTAPWMNLLAPIAKPVFAWNHDYVMRNGGEGLARLVGAPLLVSD